ncbi:MAG: hypothetical protein HQL96_16045 [Magnetococcales bacterium]|nr:hypothetical protein [Magnetococcales bacterium]
MTRWLLLALLPVIAWGVWWDGQHYDPGLLDFKQAGARLSPLADLLPERIGTLPRVGEPRLFGKENLHEYVNGHAEFFISAGFAQLAVGEYGSGGRPEVVVDIYEMGKPLHAFGVISQEGNPGARPVAIGEMGSREGRGLRFIVGSRYVKLTAFADNAPLEAVGEAVARASGGEAGVTKFRFPELGEELATRFFKEGYRGLDFFTNVLERTFRREGREVQGFLAENGAQLENRLSAFLAREGIPLVREERDGRVVTLVKDPYEGEWFYLRDGERLLGAFGISPDAAWEPVKRFLADGDAAQGGKK